MQQRHASALCRFSSVLCSLIILAACGGGGGDSSSSSSVGRGDAPDTENLRFNRSYPYGQNSKIRYQHTNHNKEPSQLEVFYSELLVLGENHTHDSWRDIVLPKSNKSFRLEEAIESKTNFINFHSYGFIKPPGFSVNINLYFPERLPFYKDGLQAGQSLSFEDKPVDLKFGSAPPSMSPATKTALNYLKSEGRISQEDIDQFPVLVSGSSAVLSKGVWLHDKYSPARDYVEVETLMTVDASKFHELAHGAFQEYKDHFIFKDSVSDLQDLPKQFFLKIKMKLVQGLGAVERDYQFSSSNDKNADGIHDIFYQASYREYDYSLIDRDYDHWVDESDRFPRDEFKH